MQPTGSITGMWVCYTHSDLPSLQQVLSFHYFDCAHKVFSAVSSLLKCLFKAPNTFQPLKCNAVDGKPPSALINALKELSKPSTFFCSLQSFALITFDLLFFCSGVTDHTAGSMAA